jgi:hypothetical protein
LLPNFSAKTGVEINAVSIKVARIFMVTLSTICRRIIVAAKGRDGSKHLGFTVKNGTFVDLQNGGLDCSTHNGRSLDTLHAEIAKISPVNWPEIDHNVGFNLATDLGLIAD